MTTRITSRSISPLFGGVFVAGVCAAGVCADSSLVCSTIATLAGMNQPGEVGLDGMVGDAGQRHTIAGAHVPAGEDDVADAGDQLGVVVERFVEIAETERDDGVGELLDLVLKRWQISGFDFALPRGWGGSDDESQVPVDLAQVEGEIQHLAGIPTGPATGHVTHSKLLLRFSSRAYQK